MLIFLYLNSIIYLAPNTSDNCEEGAVRLMDGQQQVTYEGIVEICHQNYWTSICPSGWNDVDAVVTCRQLGFTIIGKNLKVFKKSMIFSMQVLGLH